VWLYDLLSGKYSIGRHRFLSIDDITALAPGNSSGWFGLVVLNIMMPKWI